MMKYLAIFAVIMFSCCFLGCGLEPTIVSTTKSSTSASANRGGERLVTYTLSTEQSEQLQFSWGYHASGSFQMECENQFQGSPGVLSYWDFLEANRADFDISSVSCNKFYQLGLQYSNHSVNKRIFQYHVLGLSPYQGTGVDTTKLPVGIRFKTTRQGNLADLEFLQMSAEEIVLGRTGYQGTGYALGRSTTTSIKILYCGVGNSTNQSGYVVTGAQVYYQPNSLQTSAEIKGITITCSKLQKN